MRISRAVLAALTLAGPSIVGLGAAAAPALAADTFKALPIDSLSDIIVDGVTKRVFLSDTWNDKIVATDYSGAVVDEAAVGNVDDLALFDGLLYTTNSSEHAIVALDPATLDEVKRYPLGADIYPEQVVTAGGKLWFTYSEGDRGSFGSVDPADGSVWVSPPAEEDEFGDVPPNIYTSPRTPDTIVVAGGPFSYGASLTTYDVSSGSAVRQSRTFTDRAGIEQAITPDGGHLIRVTDRGTSQIALADLSAGITYPSYERANGVDVGTDGRVAISVANQTTGDDVYIFAPGGTTAAQTIRLPEGSRPSQPGSGELSGDGIQARGIAWEPGGDRLFGVARYDGSYRLWVMNDQPAPLADPRITIDGQNSVHDYGSTIKITAHLGATGTNRTVEIWANSPGPVVNRLVKKGTVDSAGNLSATMKLTYNTNFTAKFTGDSRFAARSAFSTVYTRVAVRTKVTGHYRTAKIKKVAYQYFRKKATPKLTTTMTAYPGRHQRTLVEYWSGGKWKSWSTKTTKLTAKGTTVVKFTGTHRVGTKYRVRSAYVRGLRGESANFYTYGAYKYFTFTK